MTLYTGRTTRTNTYNYKYNKITTICDMAHILPKQQGEREGPTEDDEPIICTASLHVTSRHVMSCHVNYKYTILYYNILSTE